jgi:hypothetical protein
LTEGILCRHPSRLPLLGGAQLIPQKTVVKTAG